MRHEIVSQNPDVEVRFYLSKDQGSYVTPHWHDSIEMIYMLEGTVTISYENKQQTVKPGEFSVINSRVIHSVLSSNNKALVLQVPKEVIKKYVPSIEANFIEVDVTVQPSAEHNDLSTG